MKRWVLLGHMLEQYTVLPPVQTSMCAHAVVQRQGQGCLPQEPSLIWALEMWGAGEAPCELGVPHVEEPAGTAGAGCQLLLLSASLCSHCKQPSLAAEVVQPPCCTIPYSRLAPSHSGNKSSHVCEVGGKHLEW